MAAVATAGPWVAIAWGVVAAAVWVAVPIAPSAPVLLAMMCRKTVILTTLVASANFSHAAICQRPSKRCAARVNAQRAVTVAATAVATLAPRPHHAQAVNPTPCAPAWT